MTRMMQNKEIIRKFQEISTEELLYINNEFNVKGKDIEMDPIQPEQEVYDHFAQLDRLLDQTNLLSTETHTPDISDTDQKYYFFEMFPLN